MRTFIYFVILMCCAVLLGSCEHMRPKTEVVEIDTVYNHVPTVHEVLELREQWKYQSFIDSIYLNMPEQILTQMLVTKGQLTYEEDFL